MPLFIKFWTRCAIVDMIMRKIGSNIRFTSYPRSQIAIANHIQWYITGIKTLRSRCVYGLIVSTCFVLNTKIYENFYGSWLRKNIILHQNCYKWSSRHAFVVPWFNDLYQLWKYIKCESILDVIQGTNTK